MSTNLNSNPAPNADEPAIEAKAEPEELSIDDVEGINGGMYNCPSLGGPSSTQDGLA